jgi:hypothetical protein
MSKAVDIIEKIFKKFGNFEKIRSHLAGSLSLVTDVWLKEVLKESITSSSLSPETAKGY